MTHNQSELEQDLRELAYAPPDAKDAPLELFAVSELVAYITANYTPKRAQHSTTLDEAIQKFAAYARGEGDFDELDLKESLIGWRDRAVLQGKIEENKRWEAPENKFQEMAGPCVICGFDLKLLRNAQKERIAQLEAELKKLEGNHAVSN